MGLIQPAMAMLSSIFCSAPVHLLCFSTLLGTQLYQTFIMTKVTFQTLPRPAFTRLQARLFPLYFRLQTGLLVMTILTWPPTGALSLVMEGQKSHWIPLVVALWAAVINMVLFGPRTRQAMLDLVQLGVDTKPENAEQPGKQLATVKRRFSKNHAASIHLNLITVIITLWHGWVLASKMSFTA